MTKRLGFVILALCWAAMRASPAAFPPGLSTEELAKKFFRLCDAYASILNATDRINPLSGRPMPFYSDSYVVRALGVGYDLTGREEYLDACRIWAGRMIAFQEAMIPRGAYYMNYGRTPFHAEGEWFNGDSGSIGMGILATAVRSPNPREKARGLDSVKAYAKLVMENDLGPNGGIRNGLWREFDGEWWCCSGTFGALALLLYDETGERRYLDVGLKALRWLSGQDPAAVGPITLEERGPTIPWYIFEPFSSGFSRGLVRDDPALEAAAKRQVSWFAGWARNSLAVPPEDRKNTYDSHAGSKWGGIPMHISALARVIPDEALRRAADEELARLVAFLFDGDAPRIAELPELAPFAMMSLAERISPGTLFRNSRTAPAGRREP